MWKILHHFCSYICTPLMGQSYFYTNYWPVYSLVTLLLHITNEYNLFPMQSIDKYKRITFFFSSHFSVLKGPFPPHAVQCFFLHQTHMESRLYGFQWLCSQQCSAFYFPQKVKCGKVHQKRTGPQYSGEIKQKNATKTRMQKRIHNGSGGRFVVWTGTYSRILSCL